MSIFEKLFGSKSSANKSSEPELNVWYKIRDDRFEHTRPSPGVYSQFKSLDVFVKPIKSVGRDFDANTANISNGKIYASCDTSRVYDGYLGNYEKLQDQKVIDLLNCLLSNAIVENDMAKQKEREDKIKTAKQELAKAIKKTKCKE
jgi:hypothetical protein